MSIKHLVRLSIRDVIKPHRILSVVFLAAITVLFFIFYQNNAQESLVPHEATIHESGAIEVFFTQPGDPLSKTLRGGPDAGLATSIANARHSVEVAAYNLDLWSIRDALIEAFRAGVRVRVVVDDGNFTEPEIQDLEKAGIDVIADGDKGLMHHKFVVIDQFEVWTGSMNFTLNGAYRNDNNLLQFKSRNLALDYVREFDEMFVERRFGQLSKRDTPFPEVLIENTQMEVYFSPDDDPLEGILTVLEGAEEQILVMAYTLTEDELTSSLIEKSGLGLEVRLIMESDQIRSPGNDFSRLQADGVDVLLDRNPYNMHHKVIVIDAEIVITGSYNFTRSAEERNDENLLIIHDPALAEKYLVEFTRLWAAAQR